MKHMIKPAMAAMARAAIKPKRASGIALVLRWIQKPSPNTNANAVATAAILASRVRIGDYSRKDYYDRSGCLSEWLAVIVTSAARDHVRGGEAATYIREQLGR
jgi:hypothetical protein